MNNAKKSLVPHRRFKEFQNAGAWEQRKLGEVVEITMGQSPSSKNYTENPNDHILVQGNADMKNGHVVPRVWTTQITKQAEKGDLILSVRAPVGDIGKTDYDVVLGRGVAAIKGNSFIFQLLTKMKINGYWTRFSTGSTFESINCDNIKNAQISIPSLREQEKIGGLFNEFDSLIALHQRKLNKLKKLKSAYLTEMFPDEGEHKPKRRFAGFTDDWEQRKLGDMGNVITGNTPSTKDKSNWTTDKNKGHIWITPTDINRKVLFDSERYLSDKGWLKARKIPKNSVLITSIASIGKNAINGIDAAFNQQINALILQNNNYYFVLSLMDKEKKRFEALAGQTATPIINKSTFSSFQLQIPSENEQNKIGNFFKKIDNLITLHQRKIDKLQKLKNAYLNEMFV